MRRHPYLLLLSVILLLAACGGDGDSADGEAAASTTTTSSTSTTTSTTTTTTTVAPTTTQGVVTTSTTLYPLPVVSTLDDLLALDRPIVAGHAGGDRSYPHSTMYGFVEAARAGVDVLEMDVQLTGDGVLVVQHDDTVDATTQATGRVRDLTLLELQALDNAYWWSENWRSQDEPDTAYVWRGVRTGDVDPPEGYGADDFRVEPFRAVAEAFPSHVLDIEIKVPRGDDGEDDLEFAIAGAQELAGAIAQLGITERVIVTSFSVEVMTAFREFAPEVATSPSEAEIFGWYLGSGTIHPNDVVAQVPPTFGDIDVLDPEIVDRVKAEGLELWIWPNDSDAQENADFYAQVIALGADGIIAGRPAEAVERYRADGLIP